MPQHKVQPEIILVWPESGFMKFLQNSIVLPELPKPDSTVLKQFWIYLPGYYTVSTLNFLFPDSDFFSFGNIEKGLEFLQETRMYAEQVAKDLVLIVDEDPEGVIKYLDTKEHNLKLVLPTYPVEDSDIAKGHLILITLFNNTNVQVSVKGPYPITLK